MKKILFSILIFLSYLGNANAQIGPGQQCGTSSVPCYVIASGGGSTPVPVTQGAQAATAAGNTWFIQQYLAGSAISLTNPEPVTPGTGSTFPISALSLPLPAGASTDASLTNVQSAPGTAQTTAVTVQGNASGIPVPVSGTVAATQSGTWNIGSITTLPSITVSSSALPTGASTAANQTSVQSAPGTPQTTAQTIQGNASGVPVPVAITTGSGSQALSYDSPLTTVSVTTASTTILAAATYTHSLTLCTEPTDVGNIWLNMNNGAAVVSTGMYIPSYGGCLNIAPPTGAITGISDSGTSHATIQGG